MIWAYFFIFVVFYNFFFHSKLPYSFLWLFINLIYKFAIERYLEKKQQLMLKLRNLENKIKHNFTINIIQSRCYECDIKLFALLIVILWLIAYFIDLSNSYDTIPIPISLWPMTKYWRIFVECDKFSLNSFNCLRDVFDNYILTLIVLCMHIHTHSLNSKILFFFLSKFKDKRGLTGNVK